MLFQFGVSHDFMESMKQSSIDLSTTEAEYIATCSTSCEAIWQVVDRSVRSRDGSHHDSM
jgi:hypothetical protein